MSDRLVINAFMAGLVERIGGVDAAAAVIAARHRSEVSKGTISKRLSGQLDWPLVDILALEDALADPCVSRWRAHSLPEVAEGATLMAGLAEVAREHGEAVAAVMDYTAGRGDRARAAKEVSDAVSATRRLAAMMDREGEA